MWLVPLTIPYGHIHVTSSQNPQQPSNSSECAIFVLSCFFFSKTAHSVCFTWTDLQYFVKDYFLLIPCVKRITLSQSRPTVSYLSSLNITNDLVFYLFQKNRDSWERSKWRVRFDSRYFFFFLNLRWMMVVPPSCNLASLI